MAEKSDKVNEAVNYCRENPQASIRTVAQVFAIPRSTLQDHLNGRPTLSERPANNRLFSDAQETALCRYIDRLELVNLAVRKEMVQEAANFILSAMHPENETTEPPTVGTQWVARFLKRHEYLTVPQRTLEQDRQFAEDEEVFQAWYEQLKEVLEEEGFQPGDIWNMDETGFRIGVGKDQLMVTRRRRRHYLAMPTCRESATSIEAISASGEVIPAFLILTGKTHLERWYHTALSPETVLSVSESGYNNDELALHWIKHFEKHTRNRTVGAKRLLLLDGYGAHHTYPFLKFCKAHNIIPFGFPPHTTHLLQPLDVAVFQPLKHYHAKALDIIARDGCVNFDKLDFLNTIEQIRTQAFKTSTIQSAFKRTGIWPFCPEIILGPLRERTQARNRAIRTPSPRGNRDPSPLKTPLTIRKLTMVANQLIDGVSNSQPEVQDTAKRFIRGALVQGTELLQTRKDLSRTQLAENTRLQRKRGSNRRLQSGGVLLVAEGRRMAMEKEEIALRKAQARISRQEKKEAKKYRQVALDAAKAGKQRLARLKKACIVRKDANGSEAWVRRKQNRDFVRYS